MIYLNSQVKYEHSAGQPLQRLVKSCLDRSIALILLLLLFPLLLVICLFVALDRGPVIFGHSRIGQGAVSFRCLKFRSMFVNASKVLERAMAENPEIAAEWASNHKLRRDPRVTRVGRFLRVTSLDELPQLINVIRGEMSLVGPRPIVWEEVPRYAENFAYYVSVRPGLTGLWQVSGRSNTSYRERVDYDVSYVKNWTLTCDFMILLKTVKIVVTRAGSV